MRARKRIIIIIESLLQLVPLTTTGKFGGEKVYLEKLQEAFNILNNILEGQTWVAGNNITIADYAILASVTSLEVSLYQALINLGFVLTGKAEYTQNAGSKAKSEFSEICLFFYRTTITSLDR